MTTFKHPLENPFIRAVATVSLFACVPEALALSGVITDPQGRPISEAKISVQGSKKVYFSNSNGEFQLDNDLVDEIHVEAEDFNHTVLHLHNEPQAQPLQIELSYNVLEVVDVIGIPIHSSALESARPISVLSGDDLDRAQADTLGETLKNEVGVHSSFFGGAASSPIIRSLDGPRVLITQNGLDVSDASRVGPDHVVTGETNSAQQVEILRGPSTLFYGSGAIGGVVNIVDDQVPSSSEQQISIGTYAQTVDDGRSINAAYTGGNDEWAVHLDGFYRENDDYEVPSAPNAEEADEFDGTLENSDAETKGFNIGGSRLFQNGYVGLSYGRLERFNGIPGHAHEEEHDEEGEEEGEEHDEEEHEEEIVQSDLEQDRIQLLSSFEIDNSLISVIDTKIAYTDYTHSEIEEGEIGTTFKNKTLQARAQFLHPEFSGWKGAVSVETKHSEFEAIGDEAFTPASDTSEYAIALVEERHVDDFLFQLGARVEHLTLDTDGATQIGEAGDTTSADFSFTPVSISVGSVWEYQQGYSLAASLAYAERAPSAAEVYSQGPHIATRAYEIGALYQLAEDDEGDIALRFAGDPDKESSRNIDLSWRKYEGRFGVLLSAFYNDIDNFYSLSPTGLFQDDVEGLGEGDDHSEEGSEEDEEHEEHGGELPVFVTEQRDATLYGVELELAWQLDDNFRLVGFGDTVQAEFSNGDYLPRVSPSRLATRLEFENESWNADLGATYYFEQENTAVNETATDSYTLVDLSARYKLPVKAAGGDIDLTFAVHNIFDQDARVHTSFLKDQVLLPGRNLRFGLQARW